MSVVQSEKCLRLLASIRDGDGVITGFFGPCAADTLTAHFAFFILLIQQVTLLCKTCNQFIRR
jgi:hypothetical protein